MCWRGENQIQVKKKKRIAKPAVYGGISGKRNSRGHIGPLLTTEGKLVTSDTEEAELQNAFFDSVFTKGIGSDQTANLTEGKWYKFRLKRKNRKVKDVRKYSNT